MAYKGTLDHKILAIGLPAIVSNISTPLLGMIDTAIVGHLGSAVFLGAIALGAAMFNMLYWLFGFLRMGSSGLSAQANGRNDNTELAQIFYRAIIIGLGIGLLIIILRNPVASLLLQFMDSDIATRSFARIYFNRVILGAPAVMATFALSGWLLGRQDSRAIMWMSLLTNITNILASLTMVYVFNLGIIGVATGTMVSQWIGLIFGLWLTYKRYSPRLQPMKLIFDSKRLVQFFKINTDIFLRTLCLVAVTLWFTRSGAKQGVNILAANAILMQLFLFFSFFMDGFAYAAEALMGHYAGKADKLNSRLTLHALIKWGVIVAGVFTIVYLVSGPIILRFLTDNTDVITTASAYLPWAVAVPLAGMPAFIYDGVFIGLIQTRSMLIAMFVAGCVFFGLYALLHTTLGNHGLWLAFIAYLLTRGISEALIYPHLK